MLASPILSTIIGESAGHLETSTMNSELLAHVVHHCDCHLLASNLHLVDLKAGPAN